MVAEMLEAAGLEEMYFVFSHAWRANFVIALPASPG